MGKRAGSWSAVPTQILTRVSYGLLFCLTCRGARTYRSQRTAYHVYSFVFCIFASPQARVSFCVSIYLWICYCTFFPNGSQYCHEHEAFPNYWYSTSSPIIWGKLFFIYLSVSWRDRTII